MGDSETMLYYTAFMPEPVDNPAEWRIAKESFYVEKVRSR